MAHKFFLNLKQSWITRRGARVEGPGFNKTYKVHPGTRKCYKYVIKDTADVNPDIVQLAPVRHHQHAWLFGPATKLSSRSIIYPCNRGKCEVPCMCLLCQKQYQKCRVGPSCGCQECKLYFENHSDYHWCLHIGCKSCFNIMSVLPHFDFHFLDKTRKHSSSSVWLGDKLEPKFELPHTLRYDMISEFLAHKKWSEKLKNWHSGIDDDALWCFGCCTLFFTTEQLRNHILRKHHVKTFHHNFENDKTKPLPEMPDQCDQCSSSFGSKGELRRHLESVHYKERIECQECSMTFTRLDNYRLHKRRKHAVADKKDHLGLNCSLCKKSFSCMSNLKRHLRTICIDDTEVKTFSCGYCDSTFSRNHDLERHKLNRQNKDGSAKFQCAICDVEFCNRKLLMIHNKEVHPMNIENSCKAVKVLNVVKEDEGTMTYECEYCGKRFEREDSVMKHKVTHNVVEKIECEKCQSKFSLMKSYKRHIQDTLWEQDGSPKHVCDFCDESFCNGKQLSGHIKANHKNFRCPLCDQSFTWSFNLERHIGNRVAVTCKECGKIFCNKKSYAEHMENLHPFCL